MLWCLTVEILFNFFLNKERHILILHWAMQIMQPDRLWNVGGGGCRRSSGMEEGFLIKIIPKSGVSRLGNADLR